MEFLIVVAAITAGIIGLAGRLPDARKVKRDLARARLQPINALVDGTKVAVHGIVALADDKFVTSPLGARRCVYWLIVFDEVGAGGDFHELGRGDDGCSFLLRGATGTARVVPDRPRIALPGESVSRPVMVKRGDAFDMLAKRICKKSPNWPTTYLRATEYVLEPGAEVRVSGWCTYEPDPDAADHVSGYREQLPARPVISGTRRAKLLIG